MDIRNAFIESTSLGTADHGVMSAWLYLNYGGSVRGFGGFALDDKPKDRHGNRVPDAICGAYIAGVLEAVGKDTWEELPGMPCRARIEDGAIVAIGHYLEDKWFDPKATFAAMEQS